MPGAAHAGCMGEPEDADPPKIWHVIRACGVMESTIPWTGRIDLTGAGGYTRPRRIMDTFPLIVLVGILVIVGLLVLLARLYPGTGADLLDWQPTRSYETEVELEMQDVEQMLEAQNEYRRKRGEREITEDEFRMGVVRDEARRAAENAD